MKGGRATCFDVSVSRDAAKIVGTIPLKGTRQLTSVGGGGSYVIVPDSKQNIVRAYATADGSVVSQSDVVLDQPFGATAVKAPADRESP
jgi:hypothetical protein